MDTVTALMYITVFLFGITVGSFLNVCILRGPRRESVVTVPSHCMSCGKRLHWYELIPLFSYLFLGGRCSGCKARISIQYPLVEAGNGLLWVLMFLRFGLTPLFGVASALASALLVVSVVDARTREIPSAANLVILVLGIVRVLLDLPGFLDYLIGFFAVSLFLYLVAFVTGGRGMGGGDIKLMAVCGLVLGWKLILLAFFLGCVLGSVIHLCLMAFKKAGRELAFGPYLSAGVLLSLTLGDAIISRYLSLFTL